MSVERAYLVDASIYVFRGWHVLPESIRDAEGEPANAVVGFADFLAGLFQRVHPERVALAFDESLASSLRNDIYPPYKANRPPAPESLKRQFGQCRALAEAAGLAVFASDRHEADDLLATLALMLRRHGVRHTVVSADKDLAQLVRTGDEWWDFARDRRLDVAGIERSFGVLPHQIPDLLALAGDKIDNIPGVPGIGMATAARLLRRWDDLETLLANIDGVRGMRFRGAVRVAERLAEHAGTARLARQLTGMLTSSGLPGDPADLDRRAPDAERMDALLDALAFGRARRTRLQQALAPGSP